MKECFFSQDQSHGIAHSPILLYNFNIDIVLTFNV